MRGYIICVCLIILGLLATSATAAPKTKVPSWDDYFKSDQTGPLPQGDPSYQGAVTLWSDGTMTPSGQYLHIHQPYDMTNSKDIVLSNYAKDYGLVYASATVKSFLEATARQMRTQMKDTALRIPVFSLYADLPVPIKERDENVLSVYFGVYIQSSHSDESSDEQSHAVPFPDAFLTFRGVQDSDNPNTPMNDISQEGFLYQRFSELFSEQANRSKQSNARPSANQTSLLLNQIHREWQAIVDDAEGNHIANARMIGRSHSQTLNSHQINEIIAENQNRRFTQARQNAVQREQREELESNKYLDIDMYYTLSLIKAMLSQPEVEVIEIHMPKSMKAISIQDSINRYMKTDNSWEPVLKKLESIFADDEYEYGGIRVVLACSVRERFLGCPLGGDEKTENAVIDQSDKLLKSLANARTIEEKLTAIRMVSQANPTYITEAVNTGALRQQVEYTLTDTAKENGLNDVSLFENIPTKKGDDFYLHNTKLSEAQMNKLKADPPPFILPLDDQRPRDSAFDIPF